MTIITNACKPYNLHNLTDVIYAGQNYSLVCLRQRVFFFLFFFLWRQEDTSSSRSLSFSSSGRQMIRNFSLRLHLLLELL